MIEKMITIPKRGIRRNKGKIRGKILRKLKYVFSNSFKTDF
jgi:hypothetical protein